MTILARIMSVLSPLHSIITVDAVLNIFSIEFGEDHLYAGPPQFRNLINWLKLQVARRVFGGGCIIVVGLRHDLLYGCERRWRGR